MDCAVRYYGVMDIKRDDRNARNELMAKNWQFFGAPHVAFLCMDLDMGPVNAIDVGIYLQTLMLLMTEYGLGSCPQGALAYFPEPVREIAGIPDGTGIDPAVPGVKHDHRQTVRVGHWRSSRL